LRVKSAWIFEEYVTKIKVIDIESALIKVIDIESALTQTLFLITDALYITTDHSIARLV